MAKDTEYYLPGIFFFPNSLERTAITEINLVIMLKISEIIWLTIFYIKIITWYKLDVQILSDTTCYILFYRTFLLAGLIALTI